jgi:hypothetical protein
LHHVAPAVVERAADDLPALVEQRQGLLQLVHGIEDGTWFKLVAAAASRGIFAKIAAGVTREVPFDSKASREWTWQISSAKAWRSVA